MFKKISIVFVLLALLCVLSAVLCGCSTKVDDLEGKYIVTYDVNGGILNFSTSSTKTSVNHAYDPNTYLVDPVTMPNYSISRNGYKFTGWYTSAECKPEEKWDFGTLFRVEKLTLYAGWEKEIKYTYSVYFSVEGVDHPLGTYEVAVGDKFDDWRKFGNTRAGYTAMGYYKDGACTEAWDFDFTHPGGDKEVNDIVVYVKHIEGEWKLVSTFDELKSALKTGNVYLLNDIDCGGEELSAPTNFGMIFEGNGFTVSNFTVKGGGTPKTPTVAIFKNLTKSAEIRNVSFEGVAYDFTGVRESTGSITVAPQVAALAISMESGAKITDVSVSGVITTNYVEGSLDDLANKPFYFVGDADPAITAGISGFTANVTVVVVQD